MHFSVCGSFSRNRYFPCPRHFELENITFVWTRLGNFGTKDSFLAALRSQWVCQKAYGLSMSECTYTIFYKPAEEMCHSLQMPWRKVSTLQPLQRRKQLFEQDETSLFYSQVLLTYIIHFSNTLKKLFLQICIYIVKVFYFLCILGANVRM